MINRWEYTSFRSNNLPILGNGHEDLGRLNNLGAEGWELAWIETTSPITINFLIFGTSKLHKERIYYLKRPATKE